MIKKIRFFLSFYRHRHFIIHSRSVGYSLISHKYIYYIVTLATSNCGLKEEYHFNNGEYFYLKLNPNGLIVKMW